MQYKIGSKIVSRKEFNEKVNKNTPCAVDYGHGNIEDVSYDTLNSMMKNHEILELVTNYRGDWVTARPTNKAVMDEFGDGKKDVFGNDMNTYYR